MTARNASWDRYWAQGFLTSCAGAFKKNYEGSIHRLWDRRFCSLQDGARILDICTGNGAIALIAAAAGRRLQRRFVIDALDIADIDPQRNVREDCHTLLHDIRFHPRTDVSQTGFDNDSFDLVTGHFALEYSALPAAIAELARLTAEDGENMFVIHSSESIIVSTAHQELAHIALLLKKAGVLDRARELIDCIGDVSTATRQQLSVVPAVERCRVALNQAAADVSGVIATSAHPEILKTALGHIRAAYRLSQTCDRAAAVEQLQQAKSGITDNAARLDDLLQVASTRQDMDRVFDLYSEQGFTDVSVDTLSEQAGLIGWVLRARRT